MIDERNDVDMVKATEENKILRAEYNKLLENFQNKKKQLLKRIFDKS